MIGSLFAGMLALLERVTWAGISGWLLPFTVLAAIGLAALKALPRASAATRHLVALATLASLLALPLASWTLRPWSSWSLRTSFLPAAPRERALVAPVNEPAWEPATTPDLTTSPSSPQSDPVEPARIATAEPSRGNARALPWPGILAAVYLAVALVLLARLCVCVLAARTLVRGAAPVDDPALLRAVERTRVRLGVGRGVTLATSERLEIPIVSGLLWPTLVLPARASGWSEDRTGAVLLHELAHVRRHDALALAFTRVAAAVLWFHPLVWVLARVARRECERACDDVVLGAGLRASDYATHLLDIARAAVSRPAPGWTLAFAKASSLEGRLVTLLRSDLRRGPASARVRLAVFAGALLVLLPLAAIRLVGAAPEESAAAGETRWKSETKLDLVTHEETRTLAAIDSRKDEAAPKEAFGGIFEWGTPDPARLETARLEDEIARSTSPEKLYGRAKELYNAERWGDAALAYEGAARGGYRSATAWYNAACSWSLGRQRLRALGALERSIDAGWDDADHIDRDEDFDFVRDDGRFRLMVDDLRHADPGEKKHDGAMARYRALEASDSQDASAWNSAGVELMRAGETDLAVKAFRRRVSIDGSPSGIYNEACALALGGERDAALQTLEKSLVAGYGSRDKLAQDSDLASLRGSARFERALDLADDLSIRWEGKDDRDESAWRREVSRYEALARKHAGLGRAWFNLGLVQLRAGDPEASAASFERALDKEYRRPTTLYNLACASAQAGDADRAMRWLGQAEAAGMDVWGSAKHDEDLAPLRRDDRFRAMMDRLERRHGDSKDKWPKKS